MDAMALDLAVFVCVTFAGALAAQLAGLAYGLVAAAMWLQLLTPMQTVTLIIAFGPVVQGGINGWDLRTTPPWKVLWPFLAGAAIGVPVGVMILAWVDPGIIRVAIGALLILHGLGGLTLPTLQPVPAVGATADAGAGLVNGVLSGATGFTGMVIIAWCSLRAWSNDVRSAVFQQVGFAVFIISALCLGAAGAVNANTVSLFVLALPVVLTGTWLGMKLCDQVDQAQVRKVVLILLVASGFGLALPRS
jgi:uncharacterized membrane protein YfcA